MVPAEGRPKILILLAPKAPKQNFGCQPQTLEGDEVGGGVQGGGAPPPPAVYSRSNRSLPPPPPLQGGGGWEKGLQGPPPPKYIFRELREVLWPGPPRPHT